MSIKSKHIHLIIFYFDLHTKRHQCLLRLTGKKIKDNETNKYYNEITALECILQTGEPIKDKFLFKLFPLKKFKAAGILTLLNTATQISTQNGNPEETLHLHYGFQLFNLAELTSVAQHLEQHGYSDLIRLDVFNIPYEHSHVNYFTNVEAKIPSGAFTPSVFIDINIIRSNDAKKGRTEQQNFILSALLQGNLNLLETNDSPCIYKQIEAYSSYQSSFSLTPIKLIITYKDRENSVHVLLMQIVPKKEKVRSTDIYTLPAIYIPSSIQPRDFIAALLQSVAGYDIQVTDTGAACSTNLEENTEFFAKYSARKVDETVVQPNTVTVNRISNRNNFRLHTLSAEIFASTRSTLTQVLQLMNLHLGTNYEFKTVKLTTENVEKLFPAEFERPGNVDEPPAVSAGPENTVSVVKGKALNEAPLAKPMIPTRAVKTAEITSKEEAQRLKEQSLHDKSLLLTQIDRLFPIIVCYQNSIYLGFEPVQSQTKNLSPHTGIQQYRVKLPLLGCRRIIPSPQYIEQSFTHDIDIDIEQIRKDRVIISVNEPIQLKPALKDTDFGQPIPLANISLNEDGTMTIKDSSTGSETTYQLDSHSEPVLRDYIEQWQQQNTPSATISAKQSSP